MEEENLATKVDLEEDSDQQTDNNAELVSVVVYSSNSQNLGSSVILRGETEAARFVQVRAETFGQVITRRTLTSGSSLNRAARTQPADPAPIII